jgi:peptide/nickel transport system substrate-binding protein
MRALIMLSVNREGEANMKPRSKLAIALGAGAAFALVAASPAMAVKRGGTLNIVVGSKIPSYDGHRETTFGMIHPIRPFYSLLIRVNPDNPQSTSDFQCDVCESWKVSDGGKTYTFKIREDVKFHDGTPLTADDIVATYHKLIFPPKGIASSRKAFYGMVDKVEKTGKYEMVFKLKYATGGFIPALATPFNFVYSKKDLDTHGYTWHQKNINGTGAFTFVQHQPGAFVEGKRYGSYHMMGKDGKKKPYLDGYKAISAPKMAVRLQAIRGDRAQIEFRAFPPKARDDLKKALGDKITVQESDWNCVMGFSSNQKLKKFQDVRIRQALTLAMDRWGGSKYLSKIAIVKTVGGMVFPNHSLAAKKSELQEMIGYSDDLKGSQAKAKKLLADAGASGMKVELLNRAVDQPYKVVGTWMLGQWKKVGLVPNQIVLPTGPWYAKFRKKKDQETMIDFNCQGVVNPLIDASKWQSADIASNNRGNYIDRTMDKWYDQMNRTGDPAEARAIMRKYEKRGLDEKAHFAVNFWWYKINPHRSYVKGWNIAPSHYLNQSLDQVWLDK